MFECLRALLKDKNYILKKELELYTGGVITQYTFTNLKAKGEADLPESFVIGHKVAYKVDDIINWLEKNVIIENKNRI